ncbi:MAG TPA: hypothetical protein VMW75_18745, partial [Thermoanaerobaculia bacterium]|nr:hypothetical protein [Thermoanaerobaculia bacterium]
MRCLYLICDESGTLNKKGPPRQAGEFGLVGGILLHDGNHATVSAEMAKIRALFPSAKKVHMR